MSGYRQATTDCTNRDKLFQGYVLEEAYKRVKSNGGSPGVDSQTFMGVDKHGRGKFLQEHGESIRTHTYKPAPVKRVWIEKENGGERPLGIPTISDRVVQQILRKIYLRIIRQGWQSHMA